MTEIDATVINDLNCLIWGNQPVSNATLARWLQGFQFSEECPTILVQNQGGPCAVITAVQAHLIRLILFIQKRDIYSLTAKEEITALFVDVLSLIFQSSIDSDNLNLVFLDSDSFNLLSVDSSEVDFKSVISCLRLFQVTSLEILSPILFSFLSQLQSRFGVLCFLYTLILSHGIVKVKLQMADEGESLIDPISGNGSQSLINLLIADEATPHFFDGIKNLDGLTMKGITQQPAIGFLTLLEALRYCEVGWYLKNPACPIWILGSETHLTVLYSTEMRLIQSDNTFAKADRVFQDLDDGNTGFLSVDKLDQLIKECSFMSISQSVTELQELVDPEHLGIVIKSNFLNHFFPEGNVEYPTSFTLFHVNNLKFGSEKAVAFCSGKAVLRDLTFPVTENPDQEIDNIPIRIDSSPIIRVLQTKWPTLEVIWDNDITPRLY